MYSAIYFVMLKKILTPLRTLLVVLEILMSTQAVETYKIDVDSKNDSCPPWYILDDKGKCSFSHQKPHIVKQYGNTSIIEMGLCMTFTNNSSLVVAQCLYLPVVNHNVSHYHSIYRVLPKQLDQVNNSMCDLLNRKGFLCSECKDNYGLAAYHYFGLMCVKCSNLIGNWIGFILLLFVPTTLILSWFQTLMFTPVGSQDSSSCHTSSQLPFSLFHLCFYFLKTSLDTGLYRFYWVYMERGILTSCTLWFLLSALVRVCQPYSLWVLVTFHQCTHVFCAFSLTI